MYDSTGYFIKNGIPFQKKWDSISKKNGIPFHKKWDSISKKMGFYITKILILIFKIKIMNIKIIIEN